MTGKKKSTKTAAKETRAKKITPRRTAGRNATTPKVKEPTRKNLDIYGAAPISWSRAFTALEGSTAGSYWLATTKPDGRPHVAAVGALWVDGKIYFVTGARTRKGRNLAANAHCAVSVSLTGIDLVIEGTAVCVTDRPTLLHLAERYAAQGWPASVSGRALTAKYSAPSAGPPPWNLYVVRPTTAFGVATAEPSGATRWEFDNPGSDRT
jgi:pyridoxamine 5'-phosphate oxidase-like protein